MCRAFDESPPNAFRSAATWTRMFASSTNVFGHTRVTICSFSTTSPACSVRSVNISMARLPTRIGVSPSRRSCWAGIRRNDPKTIACSVSLGDEGATGQPFKAVKPIFRRFESRVSFKVGYQRAIRDLPMRSDEIPEHCQHPQGYYAMMSALRPQQRLASFASTPGANVRAPTCSAIPPHSSVGI
jgi:hypothetical protein